MSHGHGYYAASAHLISVQAGRLGSVLTYWLRHKEKVPSGRREPFTSTKTMHLEKNQSALFDNSRHTGYCLQFSEKRFQLWSHSGRFERNGWRAVPEGRPALGHDAERRMTVLCGDDHLYLGGSRRSCDETSADNDTSSRPRTDLTGRLHPRAALCAHGRGMRSPFPPSGGSSADFSKP